MDQLKNNKGVSLELGDAFWNVSYFTDALLKHLLKFKYYRIIKFIRVYIKECFR